MTFVLDHVVLAVADLVQAAADYQALGFTVTEGGEHPGGVSYNALIPFADGSYVELIAFHRPAPAHRWWRILDAAGEGFVDYAVLPADIGPDIAAVRSRGLAYGDPETGGRTRPDGVELAWSTAWPPGPDLPFFCFDLTPRSYRVPDCDARTHANGVTGIAAIDLAARDPAATAARLLALTGVEGPPRLGDTRLIVHGGALEPRGEGPVALHLRGASVAFDPALCHGAALRPA